MPGTHDREQPAPAYGNPVRSLPKSEPPLVPKGGGLGAGSFNLKTSAGASSITILSAHSTISRDKTGGEEAHQAILLAEMGQKLRGGAQRSTHPRVVETRHVVRQRARTPTPEQDTNLSHANSFDGLDDQIYERFRFRAVNNPAALPLFQQQQQAQQALMAQQAFNANMAGVNGMQMDPMNAAQLAAMRQGMRPQRYNPQVQVMLTQQIALNQHHAQLLQQQAQQQGQQQAQKQSRQTMQELRNTSDPIVPRPFHVRTEGKRQRLGPQSPSWLGTKLPKWSSKERRRAEKLAIRQRRTAGNVDQVHVNQSDGSNIETL